MAKETPAEAKRRHVAILSRAWDAVGIPEDDVPEAAESSYRDVRAIVYAVVPGRQRHRNIAALMDAGVKAAARRIRRG